MPGVASRRREQHSCAKTNTAGVTSSGVLQRWRQRCRGVQAVKTLARRLRPQFLDMRPVLLVIDMQQHFREMAKSCLPPLNALIGTCHSLSIPVIYTQHGHLDPEAEEASSVLVRWWGAGGSIRCAGACLRLQSAGAAGLSIASCSCGNPCRCLSPLPGMAPRPGSCCPSCSGARGRIRSSPPSGHTMPFTAQSCCSCCSARGATPSL
jgi:hypothetical protein